MSEEISNLTDYFMFLFEKKLINWEDISNNKIKSFYDKSVIRIGYWIKDRNFAIDLAKSMEQALKLKGIKNITFVNNHVTALIVGNLAIGFITYDDDTSSIGNLDFAFVHYPEESSNMKKTISIASYSVSYSSDCEILDRQYGRLFINWKEEK